MIWAALAAGCAVMLLAGSSSPAAQIRRLARATRQTRPVPMVWWAVTGPVLLTAVGAVFGWRALCWTGAGMIALGTIGWLIAAHRRRAAAARRAEETAVAARMLSSLLTTGQVPSAALAAAAQDCACLAPAASAAQLGGDVGEELARAATVHGQEGMGLIAAAWRLSERSGAPIAEVLAGVGERLRAERGVRAVVETELAAARSSGHIMAALPFAAVALGIAAGADPIAYLLGEAMGGVLVLAGVSLTAAGVVWIDQLAARHTRRNNTWSP